MFLLMQISDHGDGLVRVLFASIPGALRGTRALVNLHANCWLMHPVLRLSLSVCVHVCCRCVRPVGSDAAAGSS